MTITDIKKELYKSKVNAKFSHYCAGKLFYTVELQNGQIFQFPINTTEAKYEGGIQLSSDLGNTPFNAEIRASELNRWIAKAYEKGDFICCNKAPELRFDMIETYDERSNLAGTV